MVKPRNNNNRRRNRRSGGGNGNNFESNGPSIKVRGSSKQIYEKYLSLARDARSSGDAVLQESYSQHAEHYARLLIESGKFENNDNASNSKPSNEVKSDDQTGNKNSDDVKQVSQEDGQENIISIPETDQLDVAESS
jgi:E3 ubiquitin-protein ligase DOA10